MTMTRRAIILSLLFVAVAAGAIFGKRWLAIDRCLDNGGRWDYQNSRCEGGTR